jgi:hypothetical protein
MATKPDRVIVPFRVSRDYRAALQKKARTERRTVSAVIKLALEARYKDLPEE